VCVGVELRMRRQPKVTQRREDPVNRRQRLGTWFGFNGPYKPWVHTLAAATPAFPSPRWDCWNAWNAGVCSRGRCSFLGNCLSKLPGWLLVRIHCTYQDSERPGGKQGRGGVCPAEASPSTTGSGARMQKLRAGSVRSSFFNGFSLPDLLRKLRRPCTEYMLCCQTLIDPGEPVLAMEWPLRDATVLHP
jgi:hypothetical protein